MEAREKADRRWIKAAAIATVAAVFIAAFGLVEPFHRTSRPAKVTRSSFALTARPRKPLKSLRLPE
jgi:hypothetical protein